MYSLYMPILWFYGFTHSHYNKQFTPESSTSGTILVSLIPDVCEGRVYAQEMLVSYNSTVGVQKLNPE